MIPPPEDFHDKYDKKDIEDDKLEVLSYEPSFLPCYNDPLASPLYVPHDPLDKLELYASFCNDLDLESSLFSDFNFFDTNEEFETKANCDHGFHSKVQNVTSFIIKKPRTTKCRKKKTFGGSKSKPIVEKKCSHCETKYTPQWRAGPLGRNTLCNACGVRYKSGKLLPEYRPAASPTFDGKRHSNFHKKILKNRYNKII